jgi:putative colanic acid biosysnthesis UDP-glucose lipid carrier transferase
MHHKLRNYLQKSLIVLDVLILNIAFLFARTLTLNQLHANYLTAYIEFSIVFNVMWFIISIIARTYSSKTIMYFENFTKRSVQAYLLWNVAILFYLIFGKAVEVSRLFTVFSITLFGIGLLINRFIYLVISSYYKKRNHLFNKIMIVGFNDIAKKLDAYFEEESVNTKVMCFFDSPENVTELTKHPVYTDLTQVVDKAIEWDVQEIFSTITPEENNYIYTMMNKAEMECIRFKIVPNLSLFINQPVVMNYVGTLPVLSLRSEPLDDVSNRIKKRVFDVLVSLFVVVFILSWLIPILGILILLESKGPLFFSQERSGKNNKPFNCLKFRSMKVNKDANTLQATKNDRRVTKIGSIIRKTSIDEFPQFINVLKGEMSIVGPRPHMVKHTDDYSKIVDQYMIRHFLKPGITGWAQVNGYRGEITDDIQIKNRVNDDLWYLENWNIWLDIRIIFLTVFNIFFKSKDVY